MNEKPRYLGDGVYASFDGYQIWLHVGSHKSEPLIALELDVFNQLVAYNEDIKKYIEKRRAESAREKDDIKDS